VTSRGVGKERVTRGDVAVLGYKSRAVTPDSMRMTVPMVMNTTGTSQRPTRSTLLLSPYIPADGVYCVQFGPGCSGSDLLK
jgi:hypothetical protein